MPSQNKLIKQGIYLTESVFEEIRKRLDKGVKSSDTIESFLTKTKEFTMNNPLVVSGYKDKLLEIILQETNNHQFSRPAQKELTRLTIEKRVGDLIVNVGDDIKESVRDIVKHGYNNNLSQDEIAENITHRVSVIKNTRARCIARTEIARTATASDYVINRERGATHFTVDCRKSCCEKCAKAYQRGAIEYSIDDIEMLPPYHPNCRCCARFYKKDGTRNQHELSFQKTESSNTNNDLSGLFSHLETGKKSNGSDEHFNLVSRSRFKNDIKGFVDSPEDDIIANLFSEFRNELPDVSVEYGAAYVFGANVGFSSDETSNANFPKYIRKEGIENKLLGVIHNHGYDLSNFPSYDDLESYAKYGVKYGITTTNLGTIIVKNTKQEMNKENATKIRNQIFKIKTDMIDDFEKKFNKKFDKNNLEHNKEISKMVDENRDKYLKQYHKVLDEYGMSITFINEQI